MAFNNSVTPSELAGFPYIYEHKVVWGEMDALNHVNNVSYARYAESARIAFFTSSGIAPDENFAGVKGDITLLSEFRCRYKAPVTFPDTLLIGVGVDEIADTSYTVVSHFYSCKMGRVTTTAFAELVNYNPASRQRRSLPSAVRELLETNRYSQTQ